MRGLRWIILIGALAAGVGVIAVVQREIDSARREAQAVQPVAAAPKPETTDVLVAVSALDRGASIVSGDLAWRAWPKNSVSARYVTKSADPDALTRLTGALVRVDILPEEPILPGKVVAQRADGVMSVLLRDGLRALAIAVAPETGAGGFILPGDFVDVILTREADVEVRKASGEIDEETFLFTDTLISNVRVLAIDTALKEQGDPALEPRRTATLEVSPDMAELLSLAEEAGRITLSLRALADARSVDGALPEPAIEVDLDRIGSLRIGQMTERNAYQAGQDQAQSGAPALQPGPRSVTVVRGAVKSSAAVRE